MNHSKGRRGSEVQGPPYVGSVTLASRDEVMITRELGIRVQLFIGSG